MSNFYDLIDEQINEGNQYREMCRWRRHSEEPIPDTDEIVLVAVKDRATTIRGLEIYQLPVKDPENLYWRPIVLPGSEGEKDDTL